jgi:hypothetical protein
MTKLHELPQKWREEADMHGSNTHGQEDGFRSQLLCCAEELEDALTKLNEWTRTPPTEPGSYWACRYESKHDEWGEPFVVKLDLHEGALIAIDPYTTDLYEFTAWGEQLALPAKPKSVRDINKASDVKGWP